MAEFDGGMQDIITAGTDILKTSGDPVLVRDYLLDQVGPTQTESLKAAYLGIGRTALWDESIESGQSLALLESFPMLMDRGVGMNLAEIGQELVADERFAYRGREVLRLSARTLESAARDVGLDFRHAPLPLVSERAAFLLEDYGRVADLQARAGDEDGARATAHNMSSYLIRLSADVDPVADRDISALLDDRLRTTVRYIGGLNTGQAQRLFRAIHDEQVRERTVHNLTEDFSKGLLAVGRVDEALAALRAQEYAFHPLWEEAAQLLQAGEHDTVGAFVDAVEQHLPGYYSECDEDLISQTPMMEVLTATRRDTFIEGAFRSLLMEDVGAALKSIERFAYSCGLQNNITRLQIMTDELALDKLQNNTVYDAFQKGLDDSPGQG